MSRASVAPSGSSLLQAATQPLVDTGKYFCPFLDRGFCRESDSCNFSHECLESTKIPNDYCHFYLANQCLYGRDCKFIHGEPDDEPSILASFANLSSGPDLSINSLANDGNQIGDDDDDDDELVSNNTNHEHEEEYFDVSERLDGDETSMPTRDGGQLHNNDNNNGSDRDERVPIRGRFIGFRRLGRESVHRFSRDNQGTADRGDAQQQQHHQQIKKESTTQGPSSRLRANISHRCTTTDNTAHASSSRPSQYESAQSSSHNSIGSRIINTTTPSTSNNSIKSSTSSKTQARSWQGARLIASIRNNNLAEPDPPKVADDSASSEKDLPLCPYSLASGECPFPHGQCSYLHGDVCDLCYSPCLHPLNETQRRQHRDECLKEHEREMELSFAVQRSKDKVCGICMDTVVEKKPITSSRFGILEKCNHIFCLDCIRKWRGSKQFENRTIRACPECRVSSDFVVPSKYWIEDQDDKDKLIQDYKSALRAKPCRYFNEGKGECPFAGSCFYRHAYPDGRLAVLEAPKPRRRLYNARGIASDVANYIFWNFISTGDDNLSDDGVDSIYDWDLSMDDDEDEILDGYYGYDI